MSPHVRITDNALAVECVLPCHEAADWVLREYGEGPSTLPCIHTAAALLQPSTTIPGQDPTL